MERANIIAKGKVRKVGYRDVVQEIARELGVVGYVENLKPYDVEVTDLEITYGEPTGEFEYFEIRRGDWREELGERLDTAGKYLYKSVTLGEKSVEIGEKTVEKLDTFHQDTIQRFDNLDERYGKISEIMENMWLITK